MSINYDDLGVVIKTFRDEDAVLRVYKSIIDDRAYYTITKEEVVKNSGEQRVLKGDERSLTLDKFKIDLTEK